MRIISKSGYLPFAILLSSCGPTGVNAPSLSSQDNAPRNISQESVSAQTPVDGWVKLQGRWTKRSYVVRGNSAYIDEHIRIPAGSFQRNAPNEAADNSLGLISRKSSTANAIDMNYLWPGMRVPYRIAADVDDVRKQAIAAAIAQFKDRTPILFEPATAADTRIMDIRFDPNAPGCAAASLGYQPASATSAPDANHVIMANLDACKLDLRLPALFMHEFAHAIGMDHEWARPDRDNFIGFNLSNLTFPQGTTFDTWFYKKTTTDRYISGLFDPNAITMYFPYIFSLSNNPAVPVIYLKAGSDPTANPPKFNVDFFPVELSRGDRASIAELYASQGAPIISELSDMNMTLNSVQFVDFSVSIAAPATVNCSNVSISPLDPAVLTTSLLQLNSGMCRLSLYSKGKTGYADVEVKLAKNPGTERPQASTRVFTVKIGNPVAPPQGIQFETRTFAANLVRQRTITAIQSSDADVGEKFTYSLSGPDAASFVVLGRHLVSATTLSKQKYELTVTAKDRAGLTSSANLAVCVDAAQCPAPPPPPAPAQPETPPVDSMNPVNDVIFGGPTIGADAETGVAPLWINFTATNSDVPTSSGATYEWIFEGGYSVKAAKVSRYFNKAGEINVTLKITQPNGSVQTTNKKITLKSQSQ